MSCSEYKDLVSGYIDDALSPRERQRVCSHVVECSACARRLARYRQIDTLMAKLPEGEALPTINLELLSSAIQKSRWQGRRALAAMGSLAATALLVLALLVLVFDQPNPLAADRSRQEQGTVAAQRNSAESRSPTFKTVIEAALEQSGGRTSRQLPVPQYLPVDMRLTRMSIDNEEERGSGIFEIFFRGSNGKTVQIRKASTGSTAMPAGDRRRVMIGGREWWYERKPSQLGDGQLSYVLFSKRDGEEIVLASTLSFDELLKVAESIK